MPGSTARSSPIEPPGMKRGLRLYPFQWLGVPVVLAVPVLALLGVFGKTLASTEVSTPGWKLQVDYPSRLRYFQGERMELRVTNQGAGPLDTVKVRFDSAYVGAFSEVDFTPSAHEAYEVVLTGMKPGETRLVDADLRAYAYGRHRGWVAVTATGRDTARAELTTTIFP